MISLQPLNIYHIKHFIIYVTIERYYTSCSEETEGLWVHHQEGSLQAVCEGNPGQVPKHQHEAKTIVHNVHGC